MTDMMYDPRCTGPLFVKTNGVLRGLLGGENKYGNIIHAINSGIVSLVAAVVVLDIYLLFNM